MGAEDATIDVTMGFMPRSQAIADVDHPGLLRAGPRAGAPYDGDTVEFHSCPAVDSCQDDTVRPDLLQNGFDTVDLSAIDALQQACARVREAGHITDDDASIIRSSLDGATLPRADGETVEVMHVADEGFIMRKSGPNGMSLVGKRTVGMNDHGVATSIHADQDVFGTPLTQVMDGRAPELFRHDSPDGQNHDAGLMLVNLWIPLHQITQPLVLGDGRSLDRRSHQLRYGLATTSFLERDDDMEINDIWTFLHDPGQRWHLRSDMDHRSAYMFNTLGTPHGACTLPGEDVAETCYRSLEDAESAAAAVGLVAPDDTPPALREAIEAMVAVAETAEESADWRAAAQAARRRVVRMSLEMRMVVSIAS